MKLVSESRTVLSLVVQLTDDALPRLLPPDDIRLSLSGASAAPRIHRTGCWLFLNVAPGQQTLAWTSTHRQNGQLGVQLGVDRRHAAPVQLALAAPPPVSFALRSLRQGRVGQPYRQWLAIKGGKPPFQYQACDLPDGLVVRQATGTIEGVPTRRGRRQVALRVVDINGTQDCKTCRLSVLV